MPAAAAVLTPLDDAGVKETVVYKLLMQFATPKGVTCSVGKALWPLLPDLADTVTGVVQQWINKGQMKLRIAWMEADGEQAYDIEDLHMLLLPQMEFKLLLGPKGEALHLRGAARVEHEAAQPKRTVSISYLAGAEERVQVWTYEEPDAVRIDARTEPRDRAVLARNKEDISTPFEAWYNAAVSHEMFVNYELWFNDRLDGKTHDTRKTSRGELVRFCGYMGAMALYPGTPLRKMWQQVKGPKDIGPPMAMGQYGIGKNRFATLQKLAGQP